MCETESRANLGESGEVWASLRWISSGRFSASLGSFEANLGESGRGWVDMGESLCESGRVWASLQDSVPLLASLGETG